MGPSRLVVSMSEESFPVYLELFKNEHYLAHVHTPQQGTLYVAHNGKYGSYGRLQSSLRTPQLDTLIPHILLSTTEANRVSNFFNLATSNQNYALTPWELRNEKNNCPHRL